MLFISRAVDYNDYEVVDTDDWVATAVPETRLYDYVNKYGLEIAGTVTPGVAFQPYQLPELVTKKQAKMKVLLGIDIVQYNGMMASVQWQDEDINSPVEFRISEFGTSIEFSCFRMNVEPTRHKLTLIFDDKITSIGKAAFCSDWASPYPDEIAGGIIYDIRELSSYELALKLYRELTMPRFGRKADWPYRAVLDDKDRQAVLVKKALSEG